MRIEATLEQWKKLYDIVIKIKELRPWEDLGEYDLITIILKGKMEPTICSFRCKDGEKPSIAIYDGIEEINDFYNIKNGICIPKEQLVRYQNNVICYCGNVEDLNSKEIEIIKDLKIDFIGKDNWIYFRKYKAGYIPYMLNKDEVILVTEIFEQILLTLKIYYEDMNKNFHKGKTLMRVYDMESSKWINSFKKPFISKVTYEIPIIGDELLIRRLLNKPQNKFYIEVDIMYTTEVINDDKYDKPIIPKVCILADLRGEIYFNQDTLGPNDKEYQAVFNIVIKNIMEKGRPNKIIVRDSYMENLLSDFCKRINVKIEISQQLYIIDSCIQSISDVKIR